jgi:hypothetical protein
MSGDVSPDLTVSNQHCSMCDETYELRSGRCSLLPVDLLEGHSNAKVETTFGTTSVSRDQLGRETAGTYRSCFIPILVTSNFRAERMARLLLPETALA